MAGYKTITTQILKPDKGITRKLQTKLGMAAHACNPSTWEAETGGPQV